MCPDITSRQHRHVRAFKAAARGEGAHILLDGWHLLHDAVRAGVVVDTIAVADLPLRDTDTALLRSAARHSEVVTVTRAVLEAMSPARTPSGVVALARPAPPTFSSLLAPPPALIVVAVDVQDPGNAGAIVRSAEAAGATGVICAGVSADPWGWKALRAGMGSTFRLPVLRVADAGRVVRDLRAVGLTIAAAVPHEGTGMYDADLRRATALLIGGEGAGLPMAMVQEADEQIVIPMRAPVESLNAAVATAVLLYEARRQRVSGG